jgi:cytochrome c
MNHIHRTKMQLGSRRSGVLTIRSAPRWAAGLLGLSLLAGCRDLPPRLVPGGDASAGRTALRDFGCGACHVIPGIPGADGRVAPPLTAYADRAYVGGVVSNSPDNLIAWIVDPQSINPPTAMPNLGVTEAQARDMAAYLYTLR